MIAIDKYSPPVQVLYIYACVKYSSLGVAWLYVPRPVYTIIAHIAKEVSERDSSASWRHFQGHSLPVVAHVQLQTRKGRLLVEG